MSKPFTGAALLKKLREMDVARPCPTPTKLFSPEEREEIRREARSEITAVLRQIGKIERERQRLGGCG